MLVSINVQKERMAIRRKTQEPKIQERESETQSKIKDLPPSTSTSVNKVALKEVISTETAVIEIAQVTNKQQQINTLIEEYKERVVTKYKGDKNIKLTLLVFLCNYVVSIPKLFYS